MSKPALGLGCLQGCTRPVSNSTCDKTCVASACPLYPGDAHRFCGTCPTTGYRCHPIAHGQMQEMCQRLHEPKLHHPTHLPPSFQPSCGASGRWERNLSLPANYCDHFGLDDGPYDATTIEEGPFRTNAYTCDQPDMRGLIAGPYQMLPGQFVSMFIDFSHLFRTGDQIIEYTGDAVDVTGAPVGYPPLHVHHLHLSRDWPGIVTTPHWMESHGDYAHGTEGFMPGMKLPEGYCDRLAPADGMHIDGQLNDVRFTHGMSMSADESAGSPARPSASLLTWYIRVVLKLTSKPCIATSKLILWHPQKEAVRNEKLSRFVVNNRPHIRWWSYSLSRDGELVLPAWVHSHRGRYGGALVVRNNHSLWSLAQLPARCLEDPADSAGASADAAGSRGPNAPGGGECAALFDLSRMLKRLKGNAEAADDLICYDLREQPTFLFVNQSTAPPGYGGFHDRGGELHCRAATFRAGDKWTVFYANEPVFHSHMKTFMQHLLVMLRMTHRPRARYSELVEEDPRDHMAWQWHVGDRTSEFLGFGEEGTSRGRQLADSNEGRSDSPLFRRR